MTLLRRREACVAAGIAFAAGVLFASEPSAQQPAPMAPDLRKAIQNISPASLKGDLSFLASDALQGRYTPSPGLEVAAEFIASQFRAAGLQPGGDQDYFQIANMIDRHMPAMKSDMTLQEGTHKTDVSGGSIAVNDVSAPAKLEA